MQSDNTILLEVYNNKFENARDEISKFAELVKSPEYIHTYRITPISIWNAATLEITIEDIKNALIKYSKFQIPDNVMDYIIQIYNRFGKVELINYDKKIMLKIKDSSIEKEILSIKKLSKYLLNKHSDNLYEIDILDRGDLKVDFFNHNIPVNDIAGFVNGESLEINLRKTTRSGKDFSLRDYQKMASDAFYKEGSNFGGQGTIVLPCGAGKTIVGIDIICKVKSYTLILTTSVASAHQWIREILDKTDLPEDKIGEYTGNKKELKPITVTTYQMLVYRKDKNSDFTNLEIFSLQNWGLIIYDEVHLLPAPIFKVTSGIQSKRRLGLTATLVREDGHEKDVFCLIGPKRFDTPWKVLEKQNWIAEAICYEIKIPLDEEKLLEYLVSDQKQKFSICSQNPKKIDVVKDLLLKHSNQHILIIGQYIEQLETISRELGLPLITGKTPNSIREKLYDDFRNGFVKVLVVSKVANFSIDLPDANVLIQVSGAFGSRQEEAQRLGRILRPKANNISYFYTLTTRDSLEEDYSHKRQMFLIEQGYNYNIDYWSNEEFVCFK